MGTTDMKVFGLLLQLCFVGAITATATTTTITLNNGVKMPVLSFGANVWDPTTCKNATSEALQAGFKFIWSSTLIGADCQKAQADAIKASKLPRDSLFVAGTVNTGSCSGMQACHDSTKSAAQEQANLLGVPVLDMLMLDYPSSDCPSISGQWQAFEELYHAKQVRTIAVSNFDSDQLHCLLGNTTTTSVVVPAVNQLQYSVGHGHDTIVDDNAHYGIVVQAYSPLGSGNLASDSQLKAIGTHHNKTAAQVALRWILQHNATITTESTQLSYLEEDADIFDFVP